MRVIVVEPYFDGSHRAWAEGYRAHSRHDVELVTHPGSFWRWRMHGGALTLAEEVRAAAARGIDALVVSDMVHVAALVGFCREVLADVPVVTYFHENQLTYPLAPGARPDSSYGVTNWLSMAVADEVWFNSAFHLDEVRRVVPVALGAFPDRSHLPRVGPVLDRCRVMPVGVGFVDPAPDRADAVPVVLWNHRWEHDKDPQRFLGAVDRLAASGREFRLAVAGRAVGRRPGPFDRARTEHAERLVHLGEAPRPVYEELLRRADVVVSTARHEFFGIAVAEAVGAGAAPVLPDALAYPELVGEELAHRCLYADDAGLDARLASFVDHPEHRREVADRLTASLRARYAWPVVAERYDARLEELRSGTAGR